MNASFPAFLIPMWILGAPLLLGIIELIRTPKVRSSAPIFQ